VTSEEIAALGREIVEREDAKPPECQWRKKYLLMRQEVRALNAARRGYEKARLDAHASERKWRQQGMFYELAKIKQSKVYPFFKFLGIFP
jgi:hypothetical protein